MLTQSLPAFWQEPELLSKGKLPARSTFGYFKSPAEARTRKLAKSPWHLSLDGSWDFRLEPDPESALRFTEGAAADWTPIQVPGNWEMQGHDRPHYTNVQMPFPEMPPQVPAKNPTGVYKRTFTLPQNWNGRRTVIHFAGVANVLLAYVNGSLAGMSKDSRLPAEFDITPFVRHGQPNELLVLVIKWSDTAYIED